MSTLEFNQKVLGLSDKLRYFAYSLTANTDDAKDLLQDTLAKAFAHKDSFAEATNLHAWLYTIMRNIFINNYRRNVRARKVLDGNNDISHVHAKQTGSPVLATSVINEKEINAAIEQLDDQFKIPFKMYFDGYKYKEIAEHFSLPQGTIKSRIFLARKQLIQQLSYLR